MIPALVLIICAVVYRIATGLLIHSGHTWFIDLYPARAIALCAAVYFPKKYKFTIPLAAFFVSDAVINYYYGVTLLDPQIICRYFALILVGCLGLLLQNRASLKTLLPASLAGSTIFYFITNAFSWLSDPGYAKNFAGLIQALTVGLPQYSATPTWMFFRNSIVADLFFTVLFVACMQFGRNASRADAGVRLPRTA
jgi:hypothetical protein